MKKLLLTTSYFAAAVCVAAMTPQSASAQCNYRMNDIGRPHGYLSGPCNGAAQNYNGAYRSRATSTNAGTTRTQTFYDRNGNATYAGVNYSNGTGMTAAGDRNIRTGNTTRTYDAGGRLIGRGVWHGNVFKYYNGNGRLVATGYHNTRRIYDARGHYVGTAAYSGGPSR